jgi:hypothetical protein
MNRLLPGVLVLAVVMALFGPAAGSALAADCNTVGVSVHVCAAGSTVHLTQSPGANDCPGGNAIGAHFVINQSGGQDPQDLVVLAGSGNPANAITVTADFAPVGPPDPTGKWFQQGAVDQANATVGGPPTAGANVVDASFVVPANIPGGFLEFNNFVLSNYICSGGTSGTSQTDETTHTTPAVPELDSLVLFGAGALGLAGFALYQRRRTRGEA